MMIIFWILYGITAAGLFITFLWNDIFYDTKEALIGMIISVFWPILGFSIGLWWVKEVLRVNFAHHKLNIRNYKWDV